MATQNSKERIQCTVRAIATDRGPVKAYRFYPDGHKDNADLTEAQAAICYPRSAYRWAVKKLHELSPPRDVIAF